MHILGFGADFAWPNTSLNSVLKQEAWRVTYVINTERKRVILGVIAWMMWCKIRCQPTCLSYLCLLPRDVIHFPHFNNAVIFSRSQNHIAVKSQKNFSSNVPSGPMIIVQRRPRACFHTRGDLMAIKQPLDDLKGQRYFLSLNSTKRQSIPCSIQ